MNIDFWSIKFAIMKLFEAIYRRIRYWFAVFFSIRKWFLTKRKRFIPIPDNPILFLCTEKEIFENIVGKKRKYWLPFPTIFYHFKDKFNVYGHILIYRLQMLWIWTSLLISSLVKFLILRLLNVTQESFDDSVDQDQTARSVRSDLDLPCTIRRYFFRPQDTFEFVKLSIF